ncbi:DUF499 domain-containing protein [Solirubrobacter ginsenosidimutans]|uniref:DUF499 domain-containing protein n=1 Tax=Solirubrobacter ginsenosidimutans TaxID=490573 RepID=A0A9X3MQ74_9ACTN|nr:DUF499 domain-containing protein [Solirubrobacter ginsenosidimutans]MDA0160654.1 DUF499 domain-containing protein [Solirubrobacter ginsenosidimutans]
MMNPTPWWKALKLRREVVAASGQIDDVQMSLFQAVYGTGALRPAYAAADYYGEITHPTDRLVDLLSEIAVRLGAGDDYQKARPVTRLDQGMGGGKSHACIGAYHLAANPAALLGTQLGEGILLRAKQKLGRDLPADLGHPHVIVMPCDNMTPGAPTQEFDGPATSLYERFLWRLFSKDYSLYERYQPYFSDKSRIAEAIRAVNRPVLVIVDEILDYVGNGLDGANRPDLAAQDMAFLRALLDVINDVPHVAMLAVMIASDRDKTSLSTAAAARRDDLNSLLERNGTPATVTEVGDFADILRRRLFDGDPAAEVLAATVARYHPLHSDPVWVKNVWDQVGGQWREQWAAQVAECYPFHPQLMAIAREEWSQVTGFQRVRSTIRIFAATVFAQQQRGLAGGWTPALIGPGDLPLSDSAVREALLGSGLVEDDRTIANYRSLAEREVVNNADTSGSARRQDLERNSLMWGDANPRAAERAATFIFLASVVGTLRPGRGRGASAPEVKAACSVPDLAFTVTDADTVIDDLVGADGMSAVEVVPGQGHNKPARYYLSTRLTHRMLVNDIRRTITETERDAVVAEFARRLSSTGPFRDLMFVAGDSGRTPTEVLATAGLDTAYTTRLVVLDPSQFSLRNGSEQATMHALNVAVGLGKGTEQLPVQWASSAVFAVIDTQRRANARGMAIEFLARQRALEADEVKNDEDLKATGAKEFFQAKEQLEKALRRAYQHVVFLAQPDPEGERKLDQVSLEDEHSSGLDGTIVWKALAERDKVLDAGAFSAKALVHNLRENDYGRTLSDLRASFYSAPRLPLLYGGDRDLQQAIYDAVIAGIVLIVDAGGNSVDVTAPNQVNLASAGLRLAKPKPLPEADTPPAAGEDTPSEETGGGTQPPNGAGAGESGSTAGHTTPAVTEQRLSFSFTQNLLGDDLSSDHLASVFRVLYQALDERQVSYGQATLQLVLSAEVATKVTQELEALGVSATVNPL